MKPTLLALCALSLMTANHAEAFCTPVHDEITQAVATACGYNESGFMGINDGNRYSDYWDANDHNGEGQVPPAHVDDESFGDASDRIKELLQKSSNALLACDRMAALEAIGRIMHPAQDFFSHSNLVEIEARDNTKYKIDFLKLPLPDPWVKCDPSTHLGNYPGLDGLTTGYFKADDDNWKPEGKCAHFDLNKDYADPQPDQSRTPELSRKFHPIAKARAIEAGIALLRDEIEPTLRDAVHQAYPEVEGQDEKFINFLRQGGDCPQKPLPANKAPKLKFVYAK